MLARALAVDPDDTVRGKLRLAEGHLARINGSSHRSTAGAATWRWRNSPRPQQLLPQSPDPELGLARVYVYGLKDIDRAYAGAAGGREARLPAGQPREAAAGRRLPRPRRPPLLGFAQRARPAAGEGPDPARRRRLPARRWSCTRASRRTAMPNADIVRVQTQPGKREFRLQQIGASSLRQGQGRPPATAPMAGHRAARHAVERAGRTRRTAARTHARALARPRARCVGLLAAAPAGRRRPVPGLPRQDAGVRRRRAGPGRQAAAQPERPRRARGPAAGAHAVLPERRRARVRGAQDLLPPAARQRGRHRAHPRDAETCGARFATLGRNLALLTGEQLRQLKPLFVVRRPAQFRAPSPVVRRCSSRRSCWSTSGLEPARVPRRPDACCRPCCCSPASA